ncbi:MAG: Com family DNA-binding transcriptional regulator [Magnetococcales bacterium]|nr:Com family DNA-binding transcriptional regulator [Magnetococcales bacterium]
MLNEMRCRHCHRLLAKEGGISHIEIKCPRCKTINRILSGPEPNQTDRLRAPLRGNQYGQVGNSNQIPFGGLDGR